MELEEMQKTWSQMSDQLEKQKKLTNEIILKMTQNRYKKKINKIMYSEFLGGIICLLAFIYILINFHKLDHWFTMACGVFTLTLLFVAPIVSLGWLKKMNRINIIENSYKQTLIDFAKLKEKAFKFRKYSYPLALGSMLLTTPVFAKIMNGKDIFTDDAKGIWFGLILGGLFVIVFIYFVMKFYGKTIKGAENVLKEYDIENE